MFKECLFFRVIWRESLWQLWEISHPYNSTINLVKFLILPPTEFIVDAIKCEELAHFGAVVLYYLWDLRNKVLHDNIKSNLTSFLSRILRMYKEQTNNRAESINRTQDVHTLECPKGIICVYSNASWQTFTAGVAEVAWDSQQNIKSSWFERRTTFNPLHAEALALLTSIQVVASKNWLKVIFLSNSLTLIERPTTKNKLYGKSRI